MLSDKAKEEIQGVMKRYPTSRSAVIPALTIAQGERGCVTEEDMDEIARILDIQPVVVNEVAGFYTMFSIRRELGKYHIQVCRNLSCSLLEAERIIKYIEDTIGIKAGETTADKKFTLSLVECLGSCGTAPMMQINEDYYESLTESRVTEIIKSLD